MNSDEAKHALREYLKRSRIEQKEFAAMIGKSEVTVSRWLAPGSALSKANINTIDFFLRLQDGGSSISPEAAVENFRNALLRRLIALDIAPGAKEAVLRCVADFSPDAAFSANVGKNT